MLRILITLIVTLSITCVGHQIEFSNCSDSDPKGYCQINDIRIKKCERALSTCVLLKGRKSYTFEIDITALKPMETVKALAYVTEDGEIDSPFPELSPEYPEINENACNYMQCPLAEGTNQTYTLRIKLNRALPRGVFDAKWKFSADNVTENGCCAKFSLRLLTKVSK